MNAAKEDAPANDEISIERVFDAPRELVFQNWIDAESVGAWFAPRGWSTTSSEMDARPGGRWRVSYRAEEGNETITEHGEFLEVVRPERLVFSLTHTFENGRRVGPKTVVTVTFAERDAKTTMAFRQTGLASLEMRNGNEEGWRECFAKLDDALARSRR
jgi:uncharacterized protein YndB with AHSA1/START domain